MYLLMLAVVLLALIIIAILISNNHSSEPEFNSLNLSTTIDISNDELKHFLNLTHDFTSNPTITFASNELKFQTPNSIVMDVTLNDSIVEELKIVNESLVSRETQTTNISSNSCSSKNDHYSNNDDRPLGLYNMSVMKINDGYSGIIRASTWNGCCEHNDAPTFSYAYYINLDEKGSVKSLFPINIDYKLFNKCTESAGGIHISGVEDPRIFLFKGEQWVIANSLGLEHQQNPCVNTMCIFKISDPSNTFRLLVPPLNVNPYQRQKNWSPFEYNDELFCEYSIEPHVILKIDVDTGLTEEHWQSGQESLDIEDDTSYRGGAPPILVTNPQFKTKSSIDSITLPERFYLGVGHTRTRSTSNYLHFFYIFEAEPPFKMLRITPTFKLDGNERIQFASGLSVADDKVYISYGVEDCSNRISIFYINDIISILK